MTIGSKSQRKGRVAERELAAIFRANGIPAEPGAPESFGSTPDVTGVRGIHVECKRCEQLRLSEWVHQSEMDSQKFGDGLPCVFHRKSRESWLATMPMESWLQLYLRAMSCKCNGDCKKDAGT